MYTWAEADIQEMISTIVDVAYELAVVRLQAGDVAATQETVAKGLLADSANVALHRLAVEAATRRGDQADVARLEARLRAQVEAIDPDAAPKSFELLR